MKASCCSFDVVNGGMGFRLRSRATTFATRKAAFSRSARTDFACSSLPISTFLPSFLTRLAGKTGGAAASRWATTVQYSSGTNARIARSRSQMSLRATDCTRPADSPRRTLSQRIGLTL